MWGKIGSDAIQLMANDDTVFDVSPKALADTYNIVKVEADIVVRGITFLAR